MAREGGREGGGVKLSPVLLFVTVFEGPSDF